VVRCECEEDFRIFRFFTACQQKLTQTGDFVASELSRQRLRDAIKALNLTDKAFAKAGGITRQTLSGYLNTDREPTRDTLANWVREYKLNAHWLLTGEEEMLQTGGTTALSDPIAQRVDQVARTMRESGAEELDMLRAVRAMLEGEIAKITKARGRSGACESNPYVGGVADEAPSSSPAPKKAAGDNTT
jgi:transcriptional regulator with XRE-family HTH domain